MHLLFQLLSQLALALLQKPDVSSVLVLGVLQLSLEEAARAVLRFRNRAHEPIQPLHLCQKFLAGEAVPVKQLRGRAASGAFRMLPTPAIYGDG